MTYRNDHEAALARIDALEHELAEMRATPAAPAELAVPRRRSRTALVLSMCTLGLFGGIVGGFVLGASGDEARASQPHAAPTKPSASRNLILWCADEIQNGTHHTTEYTDPRGTHAVTIEPSLSTGTSCREELDHYLGAPELSANEHEALWQWSLGEDEVAGARSRIEVYYASDPDNLDHFATAPQLWVEYDRALYGRYRGVVHWRTHYAR